MSHDCPACGTHFWSDGCTAAICECGEDCSYQIEVAQDEGWGHARDDFERRLLAGENPDWEFRPGEDDSGADDDQFDDDDWVDVAEEYEMGGEG